MAYIEQMKKIIPFVTCELSFCQNVCELVFSVNVTVLIFWVEISPVKQSIQSNFVGPWNMPHCGTSTFDNHLDYCLIVLKDMQHSTGTRMCCIWWNVMNVCLSDVGVLDRDGALHVWLDNCRRVSAWLSLGSNCSVRYGMKYSITKFQSVRTEFRPCVNLHREKWFQLL